MGRHVNKKRKQKWGKRRKKKEKGKKKKKKPQSNTSPQIDISLACPLIKCQPLPNNISTENGKNDVL